MSPDASEAARWLGYARVDLESVADVRSTRNACLLAQQAAEKALKAVLVARAVDFPKTHSIERLVTLLPRMPSRVSATSTSRR